MAVYHNNQLKIFNYSLTASFLKEFYDCFLPMNAYPVILLSQCFLYICSETKLIVLSSV